MAWVAVGVLWAVFVLGDAFVTIILPKTVSRGFRLSELFFRTWWSATKGVARRMKGDARETFLGVMPPISLIVLIAVWAVSLVCAFALVQHGLGTPLTVSERTFWLNLYMSAATFFTLGYGDVTATSALGRTVAMVEAGVGFGFLALVIGFVPVFYQSFASRERTALLLDARAGAPPMAGELLRFQGNDLTGLRELFAEYERWSAGLLESFLSYPVLAFYRSQHAQLSWLACSVCVADACAFVMATYTESDDSDRALKRQAAVTFAMIRHLVVDLAYVLGVQPADRCAKRIDRDQIVMVYAELHKRGVTLVSCEDAVGRLSDYSQQVDPYFKAIADELLLDIPLWMPSEGRLASWQTSAWDTTGHF